MGPSSIGAQTHHRKGHWTLRSGSQSKVRKGTQRPDQNKGFEFGYIAGVYYNYWRFLSPGVEFYGGVGLMDDADPLDDQQHYIFPVFRGMLPYGLEYNFGAGFGLTRGSDDVITKVNIEFEHFIGALFN
jgi:hypothetical protein